MKQLLEAKVTQYSLNLFLWFDCASEVRKCSFVLDGQSLINSFVVWTPLNESEFYLQL